MTMPDIAFVNTSGEWDVESKGVAPDIEVVNHPQLVMQGKDPHLERGIEEVLRLMEEQGNPIPSMPETFPNRSK